jgi:riboflavin synthase
MFTGVVEALGRVAECRDLGTGMEIRIETPPGFLVGVEPGASIAVDGACLTPVRLGEAEFTVQVVAATLSRTVAGRYRPGSAVNLERAMAVGERLDGHFVQGHVDGVGQVTKIQDVDGSHLLEIAIPAPVHALTIPLGSVALNGVSLTVNRVAADGRIEVSLIPHTWGATNLGRLQPGDPVNVEGDLIGKYVGKLLRHIQDGTGQDGTDGGTADGL